MMLKNIPFFFVRLLQQLIPYVEEDSKHDEHSAQQSRYASDERREVLEVNKVNAALDL